VKEFVDTVESFMILNRWKIGICFQGCNFKCPYCQNPELNQTPSIEFPIVTGIPDDNGGLAMIHDWIEVEV